MAPRKPRKSATIDYTTDDEDLIVYDVQEEELEPDKFTIKECPQNFPKGYLRAITPTRYRKRILATDPVLLYFCRIVWTPINEAISRTDLPSFHHLTTNKRSDLVYESSFYDF
ncbi:hypothetical protein TNCV_4528591 [Trichonephila clavipes]|nr:hypothetical protein TNCV_4528591 [Trichonephila clavipes]